MSGGPVKRRRRIGLTPIAWVLLGLAIAVGVGMAIGSQPVWIAALVLFLLALMGAFAIPRNVQRLNVPPGMPNVPGDITQHDEEHQD